MKYYLLEPEVPGELGPNTVMDTKPHPPIIEQLEIVINGWLGDDLFECFPVFYVTDIIVDILNDDNFSGYRIKNMKCIVTENYKAFHPSRKFPKVSWLEVSGKAGKDDLGLADNCLVVSERLLKILQKHSSISNCDIELWGN